MKIAVNARHLIPDKLEGIGWFSYETLKRITAAHPEHEFIFFFDRPFAPECVFSENVRPVVLFPPARHPVLWYCWFEYSVRIALKREKADIFISPDGQVPLRSKVPSLAVIHDLNFMHYPEDLPFFPRIYYRYFFPRFAKAATRIATVSQYSKQDIIKWCGIGPGKIDVVYNGVNEQYKPVDEERKSAVRKKWTAGLPYFIYIGTLYPRKNIANLLLAYEQFRLMHHEPVKLVLVSKKNWGNRAMEAVYRQMQFRDDVIFTGRLSTEELHNLLASSLALTYVPYFEGFGIPVLEALSCKVPVITSNVTSLPEVGGNAALYADPFSVASIAEALSAMASDNSLRNKLIEESEMQRMKFSWDRSATLLWKAIEQIFPHS